MQLYINTVLYICKVKVLQMFIFALGQCTVVNIFVNLYSCSVEQLYSLTVVRFKFFRFYSFTVLPLYSVTVVQIYRCTVLPLYSFTVVQCYRCTDFPLYSFTVEQFYCFTV